MVNTLGKTLQNLSGPVLITGHTGFKGTWMTLLLQQLGVSVVGYSLKPEKDSLYDRANLNGKIPEKFADIRNHKKLNKFVEKHKPSVIFHMAAQPLVLESYKKPLETFDINVLGTANLGLKYGITNLEEFDQNLSRRVLRHALKRGVSTFDTAPDYGSAEELIGATLIPNDEAQIVTKIPTRESYTYEYVSSCLASSLKKLRQNKIFGVMFHDPDIYKKNEIQEISKKLLDSGTVEHLGFSAYSLNALLDAKQMNPNWTIFQVPENILDRRLINSRELVEMARERNILYVRSIFLQGLLLVEPEVLPGKFKKYEKIFQNLHSAAESLGMKSLDLCLSYNSSIAWSSGTIVAAASTAQLDEIFDFKFPRTKFPQLETLPEHVLDPRRWSELN